MPLNGSDPDEVSLAAIDAGAVDVGTPEGGAILVVTDPTDLERVRTALTDAGFPPETAEVSMEPTTKVEIGTRRALARCSTSSSGSRTSTTSRPSTPTSTSPMP